MKDAFEVPNPCLLLCQKNVLGPEEEKSISLKLWSEFLKIFFAFEMVHLNMGPFGRIQEFHNFQ